MVRFIIHIFAYSQVFLNCDVVCKIMGVLMQATKFKASCGLSLGCVHLGQFYKLFALRMFIFNGNYMFTRPEDLETNKIIHVELIR